MPMSELAAGDAVATMRITLKRYASLAREHRSGNPVTLDVAQVLVNGHFISAEARTTRRLADGNWLAI